jgi:Tol biopolymer transport system component
MVDAAHGDLAIRLVASGEVRRITSNAAGSPEFAYFSVVSPDAKQIAYAWFNREKFYELRIAEVDSGASRVLQRNEERRFVQPCAWTRDGKQILTLFFRNDNVSQIALVNASDGNVKVLKSLDWIYPNKMDVSPDGKWIAYDDLRKDGEPARGINLLAVDGSAKRLVTKSAQHEVFPLFTPDGRGVTYLNTKDGRTDLWMAAMDGSAPRLLQRDLGRALPMGITRKGDYYYALRHGDSSIVVGEPEGQRAEVARGTGTPAWSADGTHLAFLMRAANENFGQESRVIAIQHVASGKRRIIEPRLAVLGRLAWSPDGKWILAGGSDRHGQRGIYLVDAATGDAKPLATEEAGTHEGYEGVWGGGKAACYSTGAAIKLKLLEGEGDRELVRAGNDARLHDLAISADHKLLAYASRVGETESIHVMDLAGGAARQVASIRRGGVNGLEFSQDGKTLLASVPSDPPAVWRVPVEGGPTQKLPWQLGQQGAVRVQPNGSRLAYASGKTHTEIWVIERLLDASYHQR